MHGTIRLLMSATLGMATLSLAAPSQGEKAAIDLSRYENLRVDPDPSFSAYAYQSALRPGVPIATLARDNSGFAQESSAFGFAASSKEARFLLVGASYAEALALLRGGDREGAAARVEAIEREAVNLGYPSALFNYTAKMRSVLSREPSGSKELELEFLSLFQPFFEEFASQEGQDRLTLFRVGAWLVDMGIAAAAGDTVLLRQTETLAYFGAEMKRMDAPKGVQDALAEIATISGRDEIDERQQKRVLELVKTIRSLLG
jgi:hypothetical protein